MAPVESSLHFPVLPLVGPMRLTTLWGASAPASPTQTKNLKVLQASNWEVLHRCLHLPLVVPMRLTWAAVGAPWLGVLQRWGCHPLGP